MGHDLICAWLQLPSGSWPPDHYTLLGLKPGESDTARIERSVDERMAKARQYQLSYPDAATEAMNRLAQALICLTHAQAKRAYDAELFGESEAENLTQLSGRALPSPEPADPMAWLFAPPSPKTVPTAEPIGEPRNVEDWQTAPPPTRREFDSDAGPPMPSDHAPTIDHSIATQDAPQGPPVPESSAPSLPVAQPSIDEGSAVGARASRRSAVTRRALFARISRTRQILSVWRQAGKYLNQPRRQLTKPSEATELLHQMQALKELLRRPPRLLGQAGQSGYLVLSLARQQLVVPTLQTLLPSQRDALARDWRAGQEVLIDQLGFLRSELKDYRRRNRILHWFRAAAISVLHSPGLLLLFLALVALNIAFQEILRAVLIYQIVSFGILAMTKMLWSWWTLRPMRLPRPQPPAPTRATGKTSRSMSSRPAPSTIKAKSP